MKNIFTLIMFVLPLISSAQKKCNCDLNNIKDWNGKNKGANQSIELNGNLFQHPVTTFYRWGNNPWFNPERDQLTNLNSLRDMLFDAHESDELAGNKFYPVYEDIYDQAQNNDHLYYDPTETGGHNNYAAAITARACGFVLIANFNKAGNSLEPSEITALKTKGVNIIKRLEKDENRNDDKYWSGNTPGWYSNHYWVEKNLIMLLEAYDFLEAVFPNDADVDTCGYLLQCYARHIFYSGTQLLSGFTRNDNHALQLSGAVGLASVVLADHSSTRLKDSWHPDRWNNITIWKTLRAFYKSETERGIDNGFAEGPHYARHTFENLFPYLLAYTNVRPEITENEKYGPEGLW